MEYGRKINYVYIRVYMYAYIYIGSTLLGRNMKLALFCNLNFTKVCIKLEN
jgi:hypothetical protein